MEAHLLFLIYVGKVGVFETAETQFPALLLPFSVARRYVNMTHREASGKGRGVRERFQY